MPRLTSFIHDDVVAVTIEQHPPLFFFVPHEGQERGVDCMTNAVQGFIFTVVRKTTKIEAGLVKRNSEKEVKVRNLRRIPDVPLRVLEFL